MSKPPTLLSKLLQGSHSESRLVSLLAEIPVEELNAPNYDGSPLLHSCISKPVVVSALLKTPGISVNTRDSRGFSPLHLAAQWCDDRSFLVVSMLLNTEGVQVNARDNNGNSPLHIAVALSTRENSQHTVVSLLLNAKGILVNVRNNHGNTPLHMPYVHAKHASEVCHPKTISALLKAPGILVNAKNNTGNTPLHYPYNNNMISQLLKAPGILLNEKNDFGQTPLITFCKRSNSVECVKLLLRMPGINVNEKDAEGKTALHWACFYDQWSCLMDHGTVLGKFISKPAIVMPSTDKDEFSSKSPKNMVSNIGTNTLISNLEDSNSLSLVGSTNTRSMVGLLLTCPNIEINSVDRYGWTPLHWACYYNHSYVVSLLMSKDT